MSIIYGTTREVCRPGYFGKNYKVGRTNKFMGKENIREES